MAFAVLIFSDGFGQSGFSKSGCQCTLLAKHCFIISGDLGIGRERVITKAGLSAQDCLFMGKHCFNSGALARSLEWFEEAWVMAGQEGNRTLKQEQVQSFLDHAAKVHDTKVLKGKKFIDPGMFVFNFGAFSFAFGRQSTLAICQKVSEENVKA